MKLEDTIYLKRLLFTFIFTIFSGWANAESSRPNLIVVLCDDLGYGDLGCYGNQVVQTPNIDQFAAEGVKFTRCYSAAPNCSPARTGLMTGRTPYRAGIHNWIPYDSPMHVRKNEITLAKLLQDSGYQTCHVGKWHMNGNLTDSRYPQPQQHGFDWSFGTQNNALPSHKDPVNFVRNGKQVGPLKGYAADLVTDEAINWLNNQRQEETPFFMYVAYHEPHEPIASDHKYTALYEPQGKPSIYDPEVSSFQAHHGNITQMDAAFGRLLKHLEQLRLRHDTLIFFTSDNGPAITNAHPHGSTGGLRNKKGSVYEGGVRVPGIVQWPRALTDPRVLDIPVSGVDVLPTFCQIADVVLPRNLELDGASFLRALDGRQIRRSKPLYWQFHAARGESQLAVLDRSWKLVAQFEGGSLPPHGDILEEHQMRIQKAEIAGYQLFNLSVDETTDVQDDNPRIARRLISNMQHTFRSVQADNPSWPAWQWPRKEGMQIRAYVESLKIGKQ
ncbi:MAG: arylsulfatase [Planctomycetaceae bacterium]|nr:arylsulfatase [Planctomycetaceae bacterium]